MFLEFGKYRESIDRGVNMAKQAKLTIHDFIFKPFLYLALAQVILLFVFIFGYGDDVNRYIDCENATIIVEDKYVVTQSWGKHTYSDFYVTYRGEEYHFLETVYSSGELNEKISIGEKIEVFYQQTHSLSRGDYYNVIDARCGNEIYEDIDEYNAHGQKNAVLMFITLEAIWVFFAFITICLNEFEFKDFARRLKHKINKVKRQKEKAKISN